MRAAVLIAILVLSSPHVGARTWRVSVDGAGDAPTIQAAIDSAALADDLILVGPGTYTENLNVNGKSIWIKSTAGPAVTIVDGSSQDTSTIFLMRSSTIIEGLTITGGRGSPWEICDSEFLLLSRPAAVDPRAGGGIFIQGGHPTIRNNVIRDNAASTYGGGLSLAGCGETLSRILIENNIILMNGAGSNGGGIGAVGGIDLVLRHNIFRSNTTERGDGGALWMLFNITGHASITNNQFWNNIAYDHGGAIEVSVDHTPILIEQNLFVNNIASGLDGSSNWGSGGAISMRPAYGAVQFNTFVDNVGGIGGRSGGAILVDNALLDPLFLTNNIIAGSTSPAIRCVIPRAGGGESGARIENNIFWMNEDGDLEDRWACFPENWEDKNFFADPMFCGADADNFTVSKDSPAITNGHLIGAFWNPGCGGGVPVKEVTWGKIKAMYHEGQ